MQQEAKRRPLLQSIGALVQKAKPLSTPYDPEEEGDKASLNGPVDASTSSHVQHLAAARADIDAMRVIVTGDSANSTCDNNAAEALGSHHASSHTQSPPSDSFGSKSWLSRFELGRSPPRGSRAGDNPQQSSSSGTGILRGLLRNDDGAQPKVLDSSLTGSASCSAASEGGAGGAVRQVVAAPQSPPVQRPSSPSVMALAPVEGGRGAEHEDVEARLVVQLADALNQLSARQVEVQMLQAQVQRLSNYMESSMGSQEQVAEQVAEQVRVGEWLC